MITIQEIADFEAHIDEPRAPDDVDGIEADAMLREMCAAARAGILAINDASIRDAHVTRLQRECDRLADALVAADAESARLRARDMTATITDEHAAQMSSAQSSQIFGLSAPEPPPLATNRRPSWEILLAHVMERLPQAKLLHADMRDRDAFGRNKYGVPLTSGNGRNHLVDAYAEFLDAAVYITSELDELGFPPRVIRVHADGERSYVDLPADVFHLHELLRETIYHLSAMRLMIERGTRHQSTEGDTE